MSNKTIVLCRTCRQDFIASDCELRRGGGKYCSVVCYRATIAPRHAASRTPHFWSLVNQQGPVPRHAPDLGECWVWTGRTDEWGYGVLSFSGKQRKAHRVSWFLQHGRWPQPCALHRCDNPACVRVAHLFEGDQSDNVADRDAKGRNNQPRGEGNGLARLTEETVREIRSTRGVSQRDLAKRHGVAKSTLAAALHRRNWRHVQ